MSWTEVFAVLVLSHLVGDFLLQTEWQAMNKHGGLGPDPEKRRALLSHVFTYTLAYVPALIWIGIEAGALRAVIVALLVSIPHMIQDDARLVRVYMRTVKHTDAERSDIALYVDQSLHLLVLFAAALIAAA
jgi:hypothetical protein